MASTVLMKPPFPWNETVNSFLDRVGSFDHGASLRQGRIRLLSRHSPLLDTIPGSIQKLCEAFGYAYGNEEQILRGHTLFDYFACGLTPERVDEFRRRLIFGNRGPIRPSRLALLFTPGEQEHLHCAECDEDNLQNRGYLYAFRQHAAPFVHVCPWHHTVLTPEKGYSRLFESHCRSTQQGSRKYLKEFSTRTAACIETSWNESPYHRGRLLSQLSAAGWHIEFKRIWLAKFTSEFHKKFDKAFDDERLRCLVSSDRYVIAALRALARKDRSLHPVWCLLFRWLTEEVENHQASKRRAPEQARKSQNLGLKEVADAIKSEGSIRKAAVRLGVDTSFLASYARRYGIAVRLRPKRLNETLRQNIEACLQCGQSPSRVSQSCNVSLSTVYRVALANPRCYSPYRKHVVRSKLDAAREAWRNALEQNQSLTVTELRRRQLSNWTFLYRHDRDWLIQNSPRRQTSRTPSSPLRSESLLRIASNALSEASVNCECQDKAPIRKSKYRLQELTGLSEFALTDVLSRTGVHASTPLGETQKSFVQRRLRWAFNESNDLEALPKWRVARRAGLRVTSLSHLDSVGNMHVINKRLESEWQHPFFHPVRF
ncbi:TnsD family Tn7-like transposition protein [Noviherbaspirillum denitrificans]|uniref:TnsD family Tn7-like transposition protein n=1 Tax=Noviherbaspirillum denitrificans TaxID=1968433 RepID=UPI000B536969|nr:TnsD family Tn7-like transposition protein [Noviherbaspirillum denitrificans]